MRASFADDLAVRQQADVSAVGLWRKKVDEVGETVAVEAVKKSRLSVTTLSYAGGFSGSAGLKFGEALDDGYDALFTAAALGARTLIISTGARGRYTARHEYRLVTQAVRELSFVAEELGVQLAVMPRSSRHAARWTSLHNLADAIALCDATGRKNVGVVYDNFYLAEDADALRFAEQCAEQVFVLQLRDAMEIGGAEYAQCVPGSGILPRHSSVLGAALEAGDRRRSDALSAGGRRIAEDVSRWHDSFGGSLLTCRNLLAVCVVAPASSTGMMLVE